MKKLFITFLMVLFYPVRYIITYKRKSCFWGHKWGKWTTSSRRMRRTFHDGTQPIIYAVNFQYCNCLRCNKYKEETIHN